MAVPVSFPNISINPSPSVGWQALEELQNTPFAQSLDQIQVPAPVTQEPLPASVEDVGKLYSGLQKTQQKAEDQAPIDWIVASALQAAALQPAALQPAVLAQLTVPTQPMAPSQPEAIPSTDSKAAPVVALPVKSQPVVNDLVWRLNQISPPVLKPGVAKVEKSTQTSRVPSEPTAIEIPEGATVEALSVNVPSVPPVSHPRAELQNWSGTDFVKSLAEVGKDPKADLTAKAPALSTIIPVVNKRGADSGPPTDERTPVDSSVTTTLPNPSAAGVQTSSTPVPFHELSAPVTQGAMAQPRLTTEALQNIGTTVQQMSIKGQDEGQIRIRLKPEALGEIQLKVTTRGNQVGLQVQAADEHAKRILESSLNDLREHLSTKSLNLASVELSVAPSMSSSVSHLGRESMGADHQSQFQQPGSQDLWNEGRRDGRTQQDGSRLGNDDHLARPLSRAPLFSERQARLRSADGRIDIMA